MPLATLGTVNVTDESDHVDAELAVVPNKTWPVEVPNPLPAIVTFMPGWPTVGPIEPTSGAVGVPTACHTATVWAGRVNFFAGLLPPLPIVIVRIEPTSSPTMKSL